MNRPDAISFRELPDGCELSWWSSRFWYESVAPVFMILLLVWYAASLQLPTQGPESRLVGVLVVIVLLVDLITVHAHVRVERGVLSARVPFIPFWRRRWNRDVISRLETFSYTVRPFANESPTRYGISVILKDGRRQTVARYLFTSEESLFVYAEVVSRLGVSPP